MYENVKNHPAFIAFQASPTNPKEQQAAIEEEKNAVDEKNENSVTE